MIYLVILRCTIIYLLLLVFLRLMGKRTIGELQPFELIITMVIANLACAPITDTELSIWIGIVPVIVLFLLHILCLFLSEKFTVCRKIMNGTPIIIIDTEGINTSNLKKVHFNMNDLMSGLRQSGYFSPNSVSYAVLETNGSISVLAKPCDSPSQPAVPYMLVCEGKLMENNLKLLEVNSTLVRDTLSKYNLLIQDVALMLVDHNGETYIQPYDKKYKVDSINLKYYK
ncbi:MAG: DUF421 domain-containing protein [Clostridia bacterium]|nr:DUF421 domain-containing protein [Clostridia bacterium]